MDRIMDYLGGVSTLIDNAPRDVLETVGDLLVDAYRRGQHVFVMGNGGSAATATHFACDLQKTISLQKEIPFKVMSLTDNVAIMTAWANDFDYDEMFDRQLSVWVKPGDVVVAISGSGNSPNVVRAAEKAKENGAVTVAMTGFRGGKLGEIANHNLLVKSEDMQYIEDMHMMFCHLLFRYILGKIIE